MIYSFRAYEPRAKLNFDIELEKGKRVYCFIGENGAGKTQLLENMARTLMLIHGEFREKGEPLDIWQTKGRLYGPFNISENLILNCEAVVLMDHVGKEISFFDKHPEAFFVKTSNICNVPICFISAENRGYAKNLGKGDILLPVSEELFEWVLTSAFDSMRFTAHLSAETEKNKNIAHWIAARTIINPDIASFDVKRVFAEANTLFRVLSPLMPKELQFFDEAGKLRVRYEPEKLYLADTEIDKLPTGIISLVRIMQEIISCFSAWNGVAKNKIDDVFQTEGIVFIDEIEAHMHPAWQAKLIPLLKKSFPNATFYIATHSPTVVATLGEGEAYELLRDGESVSARNIGNPRDWYLEDVYANAFSVVLPDGSGEEEPTIEKLIAAFGEKAQEYLLDARPELKEDLRRFHDELIAKLEKMPQSSNDLRRAPVERIWEAVK